MKSYFTFGQKHKHNINSITGTTLIDKDCVLEIDAKNSDEARHKMFETFGQKWAMEYISKPNMKHFPKGIIKLEIN